VAPLAGAERGAAIAMTVVVPIGVHSPTIPPLRIEWRPIAAVDPAAWRALAERALEPNVFYEPAFALPAATVFGPNVGAGLVWSPTGQLMGLFPARIERRYGVATALTGWTHPYGPLGTPLVDRDEPESVIAAWLDYAAGTPELPGLMLLPLIPDGAFAGALAAVLARRNAQSHAFGRHRRAMLAPATQRAKYLEQAVGAKKRKELRRQRHRLADNGDVTLSVTTEPSAAMVAVRDFLALEARGWKGRAGTAANPHDDIRQLVERAVAGLAAEGKARVDRLSVGEWTIAAAVTLRSGAAAWTWKIAYNESFARSSPGVQLMMDLTDALLADESLARIDSCATAEHPMIDHLWRERLALADHLIAVRAAPLSFALAFRLEQLRRAALLGAKVLRDRIPGR
jgi:CelD/BcsL family acetyltransferase involved in cellulose biosynthesis